MVGNAEALGDLDMKTETGLHKWTLVLAPGPVDRDWRLLIARQLRRELWKGFYIGCMAMGALMALVTLLGK